MTSGGSTKVRSWHVVFEGEVEFTIYAKCFISEPNRPVHIRICTKGYKGSKPYHGSFSPVTWLTSSQMLMDWDDGFHRLIGAILRDATNGSRIILEEVKR